MHSKVISSPLVIIPFAALGGAFITRTITAWYQQKERQREEAELRVANRILDIWFGGDLKTNYNRKWFAPPESRERVEIDNIIDTEFGQWVHRAERSALGSWEKRPRTCLALIILLDQFSRHLYRNKNDPQNVKQLAMNDKKALSLSKRFLERGWQKFLLSAEYIFILMPLRHSSSSENLRVVLDHVNAMEERNQQETSLIGKFHRVTESKMQHADQTAEQFDSEILEHFPNYTADLCDVEHQQLTKTVQGFLSEFMPVANAGQQAHIIVSLSGGVDSMVVAFILVCLRNRVAHWGNLKIVAAHIDYDNRPESGREADFCESWCTRYGIIFRKRRIDEVTRGITQRDKYEKVSRQIRYHHYKSLQTEFSDAGGIIFGHHTGDVQENVISNVMKGQTLLNLNGMSTASVVNGVKIWRPILRHVKDDIYAFAHKFGVPYFKDSTPHWSTRGKLRMKLVPLLADMYGVGFLHNLSVLGQDSEELGEIFKSKLLKIFWESTERSTVACWVNCSALEDQPMVLWKEVWREFCHGMGVSMLREKPMRELRKRLSRRRGGWLQLHRSNRTYLHDTTLYIFRASFFPRNPYAVPELDSAKRLLIQAGETHTFGPWSIQIESRQISDSVHRTAELQKQVTWEDVLCGTFSYVLEHDPPYCVAVDGKGLRPLRGLEPNLRNAIPIVSSLGSGVINDGLCVQICYSFHPADAPDLSR